MRRAFFYSFLLAYNCCLARPATDSSNKSSLDETSAFFRNFSIGLPLIFLDGCFPLQDRRLSSLPQGMGEYFYKLESAIGSPAGFGYMGASRIASLYYRDRIGIALYYGIYAMRLETSRYQAYLENEFPGYYRYDNADANPYFTCFKGLIYGASYKFHVNKFIVEPGLSMSFRSAPDDFYYVDQLKKIGTNETISVRRNIGIARNSNPGFHLQLHLARRIKGARSMLESEAGIKLEYMYIPYTLQYTTTLEPWGATPSTQQLLHNGVYQMASAGVFYSLYIMKRHEVKLSAKGKPKIW